MQVNQGHGATGHTQMSLESLEAKLMRLHDEVNRSLTPVSEHIVLSYLSEMLAQDETVERAVATLELFGKEKANQFYTRLGTTPQQQVLKFLRSGRYSIPKGEAILEAGELLKTKLLAEVFEVTRGPKSGEVEDRLLKLGEEDIITLIKNLDDRIVSRLLLYLPPPRALGLAAEIEKSGGDNSSKMVSALAKMPDVYSAPDLDNDIVAALDTHIKQNEEDAYRRFIPYYRELLANADDDVAEKIIAGFNEKPPVQKILERSIVTFGLFWKQPADVQDQILQPIPIKDLAAFLLTLDESARNTIIARQSEMKRETIQEEISAAQGLRQASLKATSKKVRSTIKIQLQEMLARGEIQIEGDASGGSNAA